MDRLRGATTLEQAGQIASSLSQREIWQMFNIHPDRKGRMESIPMGLLLPVIQLRWLLIVYEKHSTKENLHAFVLRYAESFRTGNHTVSQCFERMINSHPLSDDIVRIRTCIHAPYRIPNEVLLMWQNSSPLAKEQIYMYFEHVGDHNMLYLIDQTK